MPAPKGVDSDKLAVHRQLKIKVGATKRWARYFRSTLHVLANSDRCHAIERNRLLKEHKLYRKEAEEQERKVDRLVAANGEEWEIKNAVRISASPRHTRTVAAVVYTARK